MSTSNYELGSGGGMGSFVPMIAPGAAARPTGADPKEMPIDVEPIIAVVHLAMTLENASCTTLLPGGPFDFGVKILCTGSHSSTKMSKTGLK
jgi:hypothetical protein